MREYNSNDQVSVILEYPGKNKSYNKTRKY